MGTKNVLVCGDCVCDHHFYMGKRPTADSPQERGFRARESCGGALLLKDLIQKTIAIKPTGAKDEDKAPAAPTAPTDWQVLFGTGGNMKQLPSHHHAFCLWSPQLVQPLGDDNAKPYEVWRAVEPPLGYGQKDEAVAALTCKFEEKACGHPVDIVGIAPTLPAEIVVIDDAGLGFRNSGNASQWPSFRPGDQQTGPRWIVLKLSGSIGQGDLWNELSKHCSSNLILVVSADQLRRADVRISRGLSWEATVEDLSAELQNNPALEPLLKARHLIVTFKSDGAFWLDNAGDERRASMLVFDAATAEGEWSESQGKGTTFGYMSCFVAALVRELCNTTDAATPDFEAALIAGLTASRVLRRTGHGLVSLPDPKNPKKKIENPDPGFPFATIAETILDSLKNRMDISNFVSAPVPSLPRSRGDWMMLDEWQLHARGQARQRPHSGAALAVTVVGPGALRRFPVARFGGLQTVDRKEIESLRTIQQLIRNYEAGRPQKEPLSIGVFGPPGAGKSFGVTQIAEAVLGKNVAIKTFNLSQFRDASEIVSALHQVRDLALSGATPVIFWDEFDAKNYEWLQYLLAPMQDGKFQDGPITHPIGMCVFIFAGATSQTYDAFGPINPDNSDQISAADFNALDPTQKAELETNWHHFVLRKGPDFKSRLAGFLNVLGPNPRQDCVVEQGRRRWRDAPDDFCCPVRRALFIRSQFKLKDGQQLEMDPGVLRALLNIPHYKAGARSLVFLCQQLKRSASGTPRRSDLPGWQLLDMHVDAARFWEICEQDLLLLPVATELAKGFHEDWCKNPENATNPSNKPWDELDEPTRNSNIQQALRCSSNLAAIDLVIVKCAGQSAKDEAAVRDHIDKNIEIVAEEEHNGWMVERMIAGWRYANIPEKDIEKKLHPLLLPYSQLVDAQQDKDRRPIRGFKPSEQEKADGEKEVEGYIDRFKRFGLSIRFR